MTERELKQSEEPPARHAPVADKKSAPAERSGWRERLRSWNRSRESRGGIRFSTAFKTMAFILVAGMLANAYVLPPDQRRGATVPVFVEGFSSIVAGAGSGGATPADIEPQVNGTKTQWVVQPENSFAFSNGAAIVTPEGEVPRTAIVKPGVLLTEVEARFVVPAAYAGLALRYGDRGDFFAVVADPNPLYLRVLRVQGGQVKTLDRYFVAGGLFNARIRVNLIDGLATYVNGERVGTLNTRDLAPYNGLAGLVSLQPSGSGATFDDVIMWADEANIASAAAAATRGPGALTSLAALSEEERAHLKGVFEKLTPEERRQLDSLSPEQIRQLQELAKG